VRDGCGASGCNYDIYAIDPDGSNEVRLTTDPAADTGPKWSPDGTKILFAHSTTGPDAGYYTMNPDGTNKTLLPIPLDAGYPSWSPDGARIVFTRLGSSPPPGLYTIRPDGTGETFVGHFSQSGELWPSWSPDGKSIGFVDGSELASVAVDGTGFHDITSDGFQKRYFDWAPDGQHLLFVGRSSPEQNPNLNVKVSDLFGRTGRLTNDSTDAAYAVYSPDGAKFAYGRGDLTLRVASAINGSGAIPIATNVSITQGLSWQPVLSGYARPRGATPMRVSLVPAYLPCVTPNRSHGAPLDNPSCTPTAEASRYLTSGTPDANGKAANQAGYVLYNVVTGDVRLSVNLTDVRNASDLSDYSGELSADASLQITDQSNTPYPGGSGPGTVQGTKFPVTVPCAPTASTTVGSTCSVVTTANTVLPGSVQAGGRAIWELGQVQIYDGGADGDADTAADNTPYATQGIFVP
jgi:dipeptidyl aminopeptidase/acylaminoacyl peptidase